MRHAKKKTRLLIPAILLTLCLTLAAAMAMAQGGTPEKTKKGGERCPTQGQQLCPPAQTSGKTLCTVGTDCPTAKNPCQTVCQPTVDCPSGTPAKPEEKKDK